MRMRSDQSHVKSLEPGKQQNPIPRRVVLVDIGKEGPPSSLVTLLNGARLISPGKLECPFGDGSPQTREG